MADGVAVVLCVLVLDNKAVAYWSDRDSHCVIKIGKKFYDIGGEVHSSYINDNSYYIIPEEQLEGYKLLKFMKKDDQASIVVEKYKKNNNQDHA